MTSHLPTTKQLREKRLAVDPAFRQEWESTALARAVAHALISFRVEHGWTQTRLAVELGMRQPQIARLETGERNPTWETLHRIFTTLKLPFSYRYSPPGVDLSSHQMQAGASEVVTGSAGERIEVTVG